MSEQQELDKSQIEATTKAFATAWNAHDAHALVADFAGDAAFINFMGQRIEGRDATANAHQPLFESIMAQSHMEIAEIKVRPLDANAAISEAVWTLTGMHTPQGGPVEDRVGRVTFVFFRAAQGWQIVFTQNTQQTPPPNAAPASKG